MLKIRIGERWGRLTSSGSGTFMLVLLIMTAISMSFLWLAFEPARDAGGCVTQAARGMRGTRVCDQGSVNRHVLLSLIIGILFGYLSLRMLWLAGCEFFRPLPKEPLNAVLQLLLNLEYVEVLNRTELVDGIQLDLLRLDRNGTPNAAFRLQLLGLQQHSFYCKDSRPRDLLLLLKTGRRMSFSPATRLAHPQHAHIDASIFGSSFLDGQLTLKAASHRLERLKLPIGNEQVDA
ncbi:hypothetical protein ACSVIJ_01305 [Pseudomonas sp. NCHU5208]|uniref:hypothetical protein n=1 Tax=unclassified Pseudomonas TaxID=196821 RepID=UPI003F9CBB2C